jgi:DNA polymerase III gamma/tau subunit
VLDFFQTTVTANEDEFQDLLGVSAELGRAKQDFESRMTILTVLIADAIYLKEGMSQKIVNIDIQDRLSKLAANMSVQSLVRMSEFLRFIESNLKSHVNRQMLTDVLALTANEKSKSD